MNIGTFSPLIWKKHKRRGWDNTCPHCGKPIKWIYDGMDWLPCDTEPILFRMHPDGRDTVVYKRQELERCIIYSGQDKKGDGVPLTGHRQHYYTCHVLKARRREYIENQRRKNVSNKSF